MNPLRSAVFAVLCAAAAGCAAPPEPADPPPAAPESWSSTRSPGLDAPGPADTRWWMAFRDPLLEDLLARAARGNPDLAVAAARVHEARALAGVADGARLPSVEAAGLATRTSRSTETAVPVRGDRVSDTLRAGFDASWEIDLFGRAADVARAAALDAAAVEEDRLAALSTLRAEVVRSYAALRGAQDLREVLERSLRSARDTEALTVDRARAGLGRELDAVRAAAQVAALEAALAPAQESADREMHRLAILCGELPGALTGLLSAPAHLMTPPPSVSLGTPAAALARRPDLRREERRVEAEEARARVARDDLYPRVSLAAAFGLEGDGIASLGAAGARTWTAAPALRWPMFDGGRTRREVDAADARLEQARASHRAALLRALGEVEDALTDYLHGWNRAASLAEAVEAHRRAVDLAEDAYGAGLVSFLDVLDARRALYDAEADRARAETDTTTRLVALHKALGGGEE